jgi:hypothetical protein
VDMKRIAAERDLLLELSNSFRADLTRLIWDLCLGWIMQLFRSGWASYNY